MRPECEAALSAAAGRQLSKAEVDAIDERIHGALRQMSMDDHAGFMAMSPTERAVEASKMAKEWMLQDRVRAHEQSILEASRKAALREDLDNVKPGVRGQVHSLKNKIASLETRVDAISANHFRLLEGLNEADPGKFLGTLQNPAKQRDIAAALFGEQSSPEARTASASIQKMMDTLADRFQRAGLTLNKREDYRTPQPQDPMKVAGNKEQWIDDHMQWVDRRAYVRPDGRMMDEDALRKMLAESWRSLATDGANKRAEATTLGGSALIGRNKNAPRQLFYKDSSAWSQAMEKYGRTTNMYELINAHVRGMAKDIATAEEFGRNADANVTQALARAYENDLTAVKTDKERSRVQSLQSKTQRVYDAYVHPERAGNEAWANAMVQIRGLMASSQLGSLFGALPDLAGMKMAAEHSGLPAMRIFRDAVDSTFAGKDKKQFLHSLGVWQEGFQHMNTRLAEENYKSGVGTWMNELTHRAMGLNAFDRGMRSGMGRATMDTLGRFTREHDTLASAEGEARLLQDNGITEDHWQVWKKAELDGGPHGNEKLLTPQAIYDIKDPSVSLAQKDAAAEKLLEVTYGQMQFGARGASRSSIEDRMAMGMVNLPAGTIAGELMRFAMQFKSVPVGIFRRHFQTAQSLETWGAKAAYGAKFVAYSALMGALATEIKALINGQNPRNMNFMTPEGRKFWLEAVAAGGGMGLYGDLFLNGSTSYNSGPESLMGPGISAGWDVVKEIRQGIADSNEGTSNHPYLLAATRWIRKNATPFANLWYAKAAFNRLVFDNLQDHLAPGASDKQRQRMESRGASYWWAPGANSDIQTPDLSKALGP
jgi:hypothetical protein